MEEVRAWNEPDYPEGEWIDQDRWQNTGMEELFQYAQENSRPLEDSNSMPEAYSAIYTVNDLGVERIIPIFNSDKFETVGGVFDSNPGYTQRYTQWETELSAQELEQEVEEMDGQITELDPGHVASIEKVTEDRVTNLYRRLSGLSDYLVFSK